MWDHWNEALHTWDNNWHAILEADISQAIHSIYSQGALALTPTALPLLTQPLDICLSLPLAAKQKWLELIDATIKWKNIHDYGAYMAEPHFTAIWVIDYC